ncbi:MAG: DUF2071 domain-containing protein [Bacteroidetes bacterium]|nr:MAG: DUF2071 domain-containing protein [Bacteroidota bacterium]
MNSKFLTAEWRKLAIANYPVDPEILIPFLPFKTELDFWNDKCYVSLVGFRFINTKIKGLTIPFHRHFEEVNLRFYVRYKDSTGWKRGVTFIKEIVPKRALTFIANTVYRENYMTLPMKHSWDLQKDLLIVSYHWKHKTQWNEFKITATNTPADIPENSEEQFITEHYWGYTQINNACTSQYGVEHPKWQTYPIMKILIKVSFDKIYGEQFHFLNNLNPDSVMLAEGSEICVRSMSRIS